MSIVRILMAISVAAASWVVGGRALYAGIMNGCLGKR